MDAIIRRATHDDLADAQALYRELVGSIPIAEGERAAETWAALLSHPGSSVWVAELDGRLVSIASLHVLPNMTFGGRPYAMIENVVTLEAYQRRGLGRAVMEAAIEEAWRQEVYKIMLLTGRTLGAKGFYEKLGFTAGDKHGMSLRRAPQRRPNV